MDDQGSFNFFIPRIFFNDAQSDWTLYQTQTSQLRRFGYGCLTHMLAMPLAETLFLQEMSVLLQTSFGDITIDLFTSKAPTACLNFLKLCKVKYYNNALFAEIQKNYVAKIRTQNPTTIWKQCGFNNQYFKDEIDVEAKMNEIGLVVTANSGPNLNNSDFFITLTKANIASLVGKHTIFGKVQEGFDVLKKINDTYVDSQYRPQMNIRILHTFLLDDPYPNLEKMRIPDRSPSPVKNSERLEAIQHLEMLQKCKNESQIIEATKQQKAKKQAMTLQILGDLPDASLKPPENILFVCKLNPITTQKDLQIIFSRFGPVKSVEVVRDWKTGQSLQYGFIQFQNINSCEEAYLKMNNVIIDDRRIQVDFSQSVSKLLHRNHKGGLMAPKPIKYGEATDRKRQLLPKSFTQGKDKTQKYDLVIPKMEANSKQSKEDERDRPQRTKYQKRESYEREQRSRKRQKSRQKRKRSRSNSHKNKNKNKKRSDSSESDRHDKKKKKRYASQSS